MNPDSIQPEEVYALFCAMHAIAAARFDGLAGGRLLLAGSLDGRGAAAALGGNIAGAATLSVDADEERGRLAIRNGVCDFLVNSLDEALRILKNEIRKKQAVSVCLAAGWDATIAEMIERGVQPDLLATEIPVLLDRGAAMLAVLPASSTEGKVTWNVEGEPARWLPRLDALAAGSLLGGADDLRGRWLRLAPRYMRRSLAATRFVGMSVEEAERFEGLVRKAVEAGELPQGIRIERAR